MRISDWSSDVCSADLVADDVRPGVLCGRDDPCRRLAPGPGPLRRGVPPVAAPVRRDDRRRYPGQQDGPGVAQGLRPDARTDRKRVEKGKRGYVRVDSGGRRIIKKKQENTDNIH